MLLDTCTFLWFISRDDRLPDAVHDAICSPHNQPYLSVISVWEIILKQQLGRLSLPEEAAAYIPAQRVRHAIDALELGESSVRHLAKLPPLHKDPFDRMLICQALELGVPIVTPDTAITQYPVKTLWEL